MKKIFFATAEVFCLNTVAFANGNTHKPHMRTTKKEVKASKQDCPVNCPMAHCTQ